MPTNLDITLRPDAKGRIALGALAKGVSSFRVHQEQDGRLVLEPFTEVPSREAWLYKSDLALGKVRQGLTDAKTGKVSSRGDFTKFIER